ncbi:hypothetical protein CNR22_01345 [Sphingobacteriaceae bacterium]|nr:hypothetical protein CNR22_01345 [Sphingobacteriaceae bacterium]
MGKSANILGAFLLGAGIGAIAGILLAPAKGTETREKLLSGAQDLASDLKEKFDEYSDPNYLSHANQQEEYEHMLGI